LLLNFFDYEYAEIAEVLHKSKVYEWQIVSRAKTRLQQDLPRFEAEPRTDDGLIKRFVSAGRAGDIGCIEQMVAQEAGTSYFQIRPKVDPDLAAGDIAA
jgi:RNA polymerase sigma-70 factor (ECF subfamily)